MLSLAIDSSGDICSLALGKGPELICEHHFHHKMSLLRRINVEIEHVLSASGFGVRDIEGIAVSLGPGSFTGLRIGVTTAKSLAYTLGCPIVGVPTLDALASGAGPWNGPVCPMIHARSGEVYWAIYRESERVSIDGDCYLVGPVQEAVQKAQELALDCAQSRQCSQALFCGGGAVVNAQMIVGLAGTGCVIAPRWQSFARGAVLLNLASARLDSGDTDDPYSLVPIYVRKPTPVVRAEAQGH